MRLQKIPVFILEEHNEAFYVWNECVQNGIIPAADNVLYHIDEHGDMGVPRFNKSINSLNPAERGEVRTFTHEEIGIGSFIMPAMYKGIFNSIYWFKLQHKTSRHDHLLYVRTYNADGLKLLSGPVTDEIRKASEVDRDLKIFDFHLNNIDEMPEALFSIALDIDLDYFSCSGNPVELYEISIEITKAEYDKFHSSPYHQSKFLGFKSNVYEADGKYHLILNDYKHTYPDLYPFTLKVDRELIIERIGEVINKLKERKVLPKVITICRSRFSGFTPDDQWEFIEDSLLKGLKSLYELEVHLVAELEVA
ncbi:UPF0489 family protein [Mucilaginibacter sp. KACC 22773]|uniref:UPF0489 family protein n=1 Tax=Mucilaginibacter sp. KACC 22773 TaxID=3025671 RepID=UPI00236729D8|nr:UPF0489 family protein [Mucilaginibacter sp. KACC 22773]WDF77685.1 UPF0489 family protein [Mucilaginibacter sp. KACC 22773]